MTDMMISRRALIGGVIALAGLAAAPARAALAASPQAIANHFAGIKTMTGEFIQLGPKGDQIGGTFYIQRPGRIRFNYEDPSPVRVIADGKSVVVNNRKLDTWDIYPLSKTPLKLLLDDRIDLSADSVKSVKEDADLTTIVLGNKNLFGDSTITMLFDPATNDLRQWTIRDAQGKDTTVMIFNVKQGVKIDPKLFAVNYLAISKKQQSKGEFNR